MTIYGSTSVRCLLVRLRISSIRDMSRVGEVSGTIVFTVFDTFGEPEEVRNRSYDPGRPVSVSVPCL